MEVEDEKHADDALQHPFNLKLLHAEQRRGAAIPAFSQAGCWISALQITGLGDQKTRDILFIQIVLLKNSLVEPAGGSFYV